MHPHPKPVGRKPVLTRVFLTTTGLNNWTCPTSVSEIETVDCYGSAGHEGSGGGAFARKTKVPVTPGGSIPYTVGAASTGVDTWFKTNSTVKAASTAGSAGGQASASIGDLKHSGGAAGAGGGGGGAAGPAAAAAGLEGIDLLRGAARIARGLEPERDAGISEGGLRRVEAAWRRPHLAQP